MELSGLTELQNSLLKASKAANKQMPKVMRKVGSKARTAVARKARTLVKKETGNYHKGWKRGKAFIGNDGAVTVRVYNAAHHAHLIEDGHAIKNEKDGPVLGFVPGKKVLRKSMQEFDASGEAERILSDWLDDLLEQNRL